MSTTIDTRREAHVRALEARHDAFGRDPTPSIGCIPYLDAFGRDPTSSIGCIPCLDAYA